MRNQKSNVMDKKLTKFDPRNFFSVELWRKLLAFRNTLSNNASRRVNKALIPITMIDWLQKIELVFPFISLGGIVKYGQRPSFSETSCRVRDAAVPVRKGRDLYFESIYVGNPIKRFGLGRSGIVQNSSVSETVVREIRKRLILSGQI
jgi:hypothetical protein